MAEERAEKMTSPEGTDHGPLRIRPLASSVSDLGPEILSLPERLDLLRDNAEVQRVTPRITSLAYKKDTVIGKLLKQLDIDIKMIVERCPPQWYEDDTLWNIVQECCIQAVPHGHLDSTYYFISNYPRSRDEYSEAKYERFEKRMESFKKIWARFWAISLNRCRGGPTLFVPPRAFSRSETEMPLRDPPRYLFRVYDSKSKGINSPKIIASVRHSAMEPPIPKINILFGNTKQPPTDEEKQSASKKLHSHLIGPNLNDETEKAEILQHDNLVSWSSSLLYVIQYANSRFCKLGEDVVICAVDTTQFPKGQFVRDMDLLEYFSHGDLTDEEKAFSKLRRSGVRDNNGEYLSQGMLHVEGRSCTLSLRALKEAGLWDLYPEFNINVATLGAPVRSECETYVDLLRGFWGDQCATTKKHIELARNIAAKCFGAFSETDMALLLLAFHKRELATEGTTSYLRDEPMEVSRYWDLTCRLKKLRAAGSLDDLFVLKLDDGTSRAE
ncbi:hypothetical protein FIE12Z_6265 [Fusarium flagelliforme]|uniref:DUF7587 domain-containing protein n=1 Tax=Fusarium flagelliforme TaxID=2675880 RepID=A0A395MNF2_9HYPO|nr:hypothetical protein FIE12Z_6265 [Fusarium flagelliforme]